MKPTRSCRKNTGPGETNEINTATTNAESAKIGNATQQQAKSTIRFQAGSGFDI